MGDFDSCKIRYFYVQNVETDVKYPNYYELTTEDERVAEFLGESGKIVPRASYDLTSDVDIRSKDTHYFQSYGWVDIVDKKSGTDLDHSTTAVVADYYNPQSYKGAVREEGFGEVYATSEWVYAWSWPKIFWDWL